MSVQFKKGSDSVMSLMKSFKHKLVQPLRSNRWARIARSYFKRPGAEKHWARIVMNEQTLSLIQSRGPEKLNVLELSGAFWKNRCQFREYKAVFYPDYDVCAAPLPETFDLIIAEQVFEHLAWPYRAARNIHQMLNPGGLFLVTTPFLLKVHEIPIDCTRWTPTGMRYFLTECGFSLENVAAYSWGNRGCVKANFERWQVYHAWRHALANEPEFPIVVWALAQKDG